MEGSSSDKITIYALGTSGGPFDNFTQCFLIETKNETTTSGEDILSKHPYSYFMVDGGAGLSQMSSLFMQFSQNRPTDYISQLYSTGLDSSNALRDLTSKTLIINTKKQPPCIDGANVILKTTKLYSLVNKIFITHSHLDHISGMILNIPIVFEEECSKIGKIIYGGKSSIDAIRTNIFNCKIWPDLVFRGENDADQKQLIQLRRMDAEECVSISKNISVLRMALLHGKTIQTPHLNVESSCYFIINNKNQTFLIIFGDCEWEQDFFPAVWRKCASLIAGGLNLTTLIIECSTPEKLQTEKLYGHMSPRFLTEALKLLHSMIPKEALEHNIVNVCITHVKQQISVQDPRKIILNQISKRLEQNSLSDYFKVSILLSGYSYTV